MNQKTKNISAKQVATFNEALLAWYDSAAIELPWRLSLDPYRIWLSEIMLQQTRVATVQSYYERFLKKYPDVFALAAAPLDDILKQWEGLGYYSRARNMHKAAQSVVSQFQGQFPETSEQLEKLTGIGRYTAAAIASIAFGQQTAVLDGNVIRILTRLFDYNETVGQPATDKQLWLWAQSLISKVRPGDYNQAMMDLGRTICTPRNPQCQQCPVKMHCLAFKHQTQNTRPVKKAKAALPLIRAAVALIRDKKDRFLLIQRPPSGLLGGLWTFPGGQCANTESFSECLPSALQNQFNLTVQVQQEMAFAKQTFTHFHLQLRAFSCLVLSGRLKVRDKHKHVWANQTEFDQFSFGKADREIANALARWQPRLFEEP
jgi:A/G-specific adenine glycosylase